MTALTQSAVPVILDALADAIEGGNTYRGSGTKFNGIPGSYSHDEAEGLTVTAGAGLTHATDTIQFFDNADASPATVLQVRDAQRIVHTDTAPWFLVRSDGQARRITAIESGTNTSGEPPVTVTYWEFTVSPAFDAAITAGAVFTVAEGFKRAQDDVATDGGDGKTDETEARNRQFRLSMETGRRLPWYGNGVEQYETQVELRLWLAKRARDRRAVSSALDNMARLRTVLTRGEHRDGTYLQLLDGTTGGPKVEAETEKGMVLVDTFTAVYRLGVTFT